MLRDPEQLEGSGRAGAVASVETVADVVLPVVRTQETGSRPVLGYTSYPDLRPFSTGSGDLNLVCGGCGFVLVAGSTSTTERPAMLIRCPSCGGYNDLVADVA